MEFSEATEYNLNKILDERAGVDQKQFRLKWQVCCCHPLVCFSSSLPLAGHCSFCKGRRVLALIVDVGQASRQGTAWKWVLGLLQWLLEDPQTNAWRLSKTCGLGPVS